MEIFNHSLCTRVLAADDAVEDCQALPVAEVTQDRVAWSVSFWKPSPEELAILNAGGTVALWVNVQGDDHPVVGVGVQGT